MKKHIITVIVILISMLFTYAAIFKGMDYSLFLADMSKSPLLVKYDKNLLAPGVIGTELLIVILLNFSATRKLGFFLSFFVMAIFSLYLSTLYFFFTNIPCSCGGILGKMPYPVHIVFNICFTVLSGTGVLLSNKS
ncbi:MauE/DoxX family redox-associated membrane protein [Chitinophaga ginsengisoli]|uniref:Methylamine utilisation protein MauE domain-containing protein n=1 Tax=Chitinophaga ginsengisoli TaxID=363837 RepID=A0A2P8G553_9BACT|nr:MauE/DoxX family redox-associated membrane protein [Chitinophaga ginsengisoli]PSL29066.1 hypothetical protein CLV42_107213 [Chitinophaga ginsengisoli]